MELRDYLRGLRRFWVAVVLMVLVGIGAAYAWTVAQTPVYQSVANGLVQVQETADAGGSLYGDSFAQSRVPTYLDMATWKVVAERAVAELDASVSPEQLASRITVTNPSGTAILKFTAQGDSPQSAAALAQAWINALATTIEQVEGDGSAESVPISIYSAAAATVSNAPIFPDRRTALVIGGILGLGIGIAFVLVRTASDRRVRVSDDVEARLHVPVVGVIPMSDAVKVGSRLSKANAAAGSTSSFAVAESLRTLRTNLRFMNVDNPPQSIVVTSPLPGDGKSTVACNLAITLAASGERVVLVDGDMRRPTVAKTLGLPGGAGLSDVLAGRVELAEVLQNIAEVPNLFVLTVGSIPPNPSELLGSERMRHTLAALTAHATVIIDAPPLLPVTDGAVLAHQADGTIVVVSVGKTTYDVVERALNVLDKAQGRVLGAVLNKVPLKGVDASPYAHAYHNDYATREAETAGEYPGSAEPPTPAKAGRVRKKQPDPVDPVAEDVDVDGAEVAFDDLLRASEVDEEGDAAARGRRGSRTP